MRRVILNYLNLKFISTANEEGGKEWDKGNAAKLKLKASPRKLMKISSRIFYQFVREDKASQLAGWRSSHLR